MKNHTPYFAFLIFSRLVLSYLAVIFMSILASSLITLFVPDIMTESAYVASGAGEMARFTTSALIVVIPLLIIVSKVLGSFYKNNTEYITSSVKKWLGYTTLVLTGGVIVGDLIVFVSSFMNGDLGMRLFLQCLSLAVIAGITFLYYLNDIRRTVYEKEIKSIVLAWVVIVIFLASFTALMTSDESPIYMRKYKQDMATVAKLSQYSNAIGQYYKINKSLPATLNDVSEKSSLEKMSGSNVVYKKISADKFEICSTFARESTKTEQTSYLNREPYYNSGYTVFNEYNFIHNKGYQCFSRTIATDFEKKDSTPIPLDY